MTTEKKQEFMLRISQANATSLVVVLYDMYLSYMEDVSLAKTGSEAWETSLSHARNVLQELRASLHLEQELAVNFSRLYRFVDQQMIAATVRQNDEPLAEAVSIMRRLRDAYGEAVREDHSAPLMKNTETVYAGMTYGRSDVNTVADAGGNRGFLA